MTLAMKLSNFSIPSPAFARRLCLLAVSLALPVVLAGAPSRAEPPETAAGHGRAAKPVIVLVHGTWADGSSWRRVIPLLQEDGYRVIAAQNPLTSLDDDVATTRRVLDAQAGPVVLVGHSYGGMVITQAAAGEPAVKALVYIAGYAPDAGESVQTMNALFPATPVATALVQEAGFLYLDRDQFHSVFCADLSDKEASVLAAVQKPVFYNCFAEPATEAAWKTIPSWYLVSRHDRVISPDLERFLAHRMGAHTFQSDSSHASLLSHPRTVADLIEQAAQSTTK